MPTDTTHGMRVAPVPAELDEWCDRSIDATLDALVDLWYGYRHDDGNIDAAAVETARQALARIDRLGRPGAIGAWLVERVRAFVGGASQ